MKTVGILGGMGPAATVDFFRRLVATTEASRDQDHLHILIDNQPAVPDRTAYLMGIGADPTPVLIEMARRLERAGAELLVIACNTANAFVEPVAESISVPVVRWAEEVALWVRQYQPDTRRVAVLGSTGTILSGLYQDSFRQCDVELVVPAPSHQQELMEAIYVGVKAGTADVGRWASRVRQISTSLAEARPDAILFACTELSWLAAHDPSAALADVPYLDAAQLVAERVVVLAGAQLSQGAAAAPVPPA